MFHGINNSVEIKLATISFYFYFVLRPILYPLTNTLVRNLISLPFVPKGRVYCFKRRSTYGFSFYEQSFLTKIWKTPFPKEFFNEILVKVWENEYIYITDFFPFFFFYFSFLSFKRVAKTFCQIAQKLC